MAAEPFFEMTGVSKSFGTTEVLHDVNLQMEEGEFLAIVGFSGSGKTTLISMMSGLLTPDLGEVSLQGKPIDGPGPDRGVVFQNYSLLPWLTVFENVELAVKQVRPDWSKAERAEHVERYVDMVHLLPAKGKYPSELSGGMRQRVSVARALAMDPKMLLLDEPLSALDALTRAELQDEIERIWENDRKTVVLITNDVDEAILLADRIIPLRPGPRATLGDVFPVDLDRPRDRRAVNHDPAFTELRNEITQYLVAEGRRAQPAARADELVLPDLAPADLMPPRTTSLR